MFRVKKKRDFVAEKEVLEMWLKKSFYGENFPLDFMLMGIFFKKT